ncbi:MAG: hypothetical protein P4L49_13160 [Desulfosporosinus sp.]|nr:hypothetical protein [Desulfosporosinus sp.]
MTGNDSTCAVVRIINYHAKGAFRLRRGYQLKIKLPTSYPILVFFEVR